MSPRVAHLYGVTPAEYNCLVAYATHGTQGAAADSMGLRLQTFKNHITMARNRVGAANIFDLYMKVGWLTLPHAQLHGLGEPHEYELRCKVCGEMGVIRVSIDPT